MRKAYFAWQPDENRICPVIMYDSPPNKNSVLASYKIPSQYISGEEVDLSFNQLSKMFPAPSKLNVA